MLGLVEIVGPIFGLMLAGWAATFTRAFSTEAARVLANFVFWFAIPVLLFRTGARLDIPATIPLAHLWAYLAGTFAVFAAGMLAARAFGRRRLDELAIAGFGASFGNTFLLGTPLVLTAFGEAAALPFFIVMTVDSVVMFALVTALCELGQGDRGGLRRLPWDIVRRLVGNPILVGLALGIAVNLLELGLPRPLERWIELMAGAAIPCALFAVGGAMRGYRLGASLRPALAMTVLKLLCQPLLVWWLASFVFQAPPLAAQVTTVIAAMPIGVNVYIFAVRYRTGEGETAAAILLSTLLAVVTVTIVLAIFGVGAVPR
jgi:malonate transporter